MKRMEKIKDRLYHKDFYTKIEWWGEDETILTSEEIRKEPIIIRKALGIQYLLRFMPAYLKPDELIVGIINMGSIGSGREFVKYALPEELAEARKNGFNDKTVWGHHPVRYDRLLEIGLDGVKKEIHKKLQEEAGKTEKDENKMNTWRAMLISLDAVIDHAHRYADLCVKAAQEESDPKRAVELLEMARICNKVPEFPAESFHEALQSTWFFFDAMQSCMERVPISRADQYLYPYFKHDMENGVITREQAEELTGSWMAKFSERVQMNPEHWENRHMRAEDESDGGAFSEDGDDDLTKDWMRTMFEDGTSVNHWQANLILGGQTRDGKDATNELTYIMLDQWAYLEAVCPILSVRVHKNAPQKLYDACAAILREGSGEPVMYNDETIIAGLVDAGIPIEDARDYSNDGCWEVLIPGKTDYSYEHIQIMKLLEHVLTQNVDLITGEKGGFAETGDPVAMKSYEEFYAAFLEHIRGYVDWLITKKMKYRLKRAEISPSVLVSTLMDDCVERGLDIAADGAHYNFFSIFLTGLANCVDSLAVIRKLVYEEKKITMADLIEAMKCDYEGKEEMRQLIINRVPKFGNENEYVDGIAAKLMKDFDQIVKERSEKQDVKEHHYLLSVGVGTFEHYHAFGRVVGASADGRHAQDTLSSNYSPAVGYDLKGPTAAMKSVTYPELLHYYSGGPLDIQINSNEVKGKSGIQRLSALIKSYMELGGVMLSVTGVNHELLEDAQKHPEKYPGLRVRLGGLSAYFVGLGKEQQDVIIRKVKHHV